MDPFSPGLAGVVAYETKISEPNREGGYLRYRGIDTHLLEENVGYDAVWGLLVRGDFERPLPVIDEAVRLQVRNGDVRSNVQASMASLAGALGLRAVVDLSRDEILADLERVSAASIRLIAQAGRGERPPVPEVDIDEGRGVVERLLIEWRGDLDPVQAKALESYWITAAEHGANASTFTARVIASTGADVSAAVSGAMGSLSGPLHGGAPSRALHLVDRVHNGGNARQEIVSVLDAGGRLMGFGHPVYRAEDPRAKILRSAAERLSVPKYEAALAVEQEALRVLQERKPDRVLATNVDYWAAVLLDFVAIPEEMLTPMFACARLAGWSAHIAEQTQSSKIFRPSARYTGPERVRPESIEGWSEQTASFAQRHETAS